MAADASNLTPRLETHRLILRGWRDGDLDAHAAIAADPEVERFLSGPLDRSAAWRSMALHAGHWALRGYGNWVVVRKLDDEVLGRVGLWNPEGWFGVEVGWKLARHAWGNGYATEAAMAAVEWGFSNLPVDEIISVISPDNERSIRVAERLGMQMWRKERLEGSPVLIMGIRRDPPHRA